MIIINVHRLYYRIFVNQFINIGGIVNRNVMQFPVLINRKVKKGDVNKRGRDSFYG